MKCPYCQGMDTCVFRTENYDLVVIRTRGCKECGKIFKTDEEPRKITKKTTSK